MLADAWKALGDTVAPDSRVLLMKAVGLTFALFVVVFVAVQATISTLTLLPWPWADTVLAVGTGLAMAVAFFFLMSPVTAIFAGLFLDLVAARVEAKHYPASRAGQPLGTWQAMATALKFALVVLVVNIAVLPSVFLGIGAVALLVANAYLLGREYFEMTAMRHMAPDQARALRKSHAGQILIAGLVPAALALAPVVNLAVPFFATSFFVHIFMRVRGS
jgi:CysZ protein